MPKISEFDRLELSSELIQPEKWQRIQNLFSKIVGANVLFVESDAKQIIPSNQITPTTSDIVVPLDGHAIKEPPDKVFDAISEDYTDKKIHISYFGLNYFLMNIVWEKKVLGTFIIGPVIIGRRERDSFYREYCKESNIDAEVYLDHIRELKLYSHTGMATVIDFLNEMTESLLEKTYLVKEREQLIPGLIADSKGRETLLSVRCTEELSESLLEVSLGLVKGNSGSILLLDEDQKCFQIQYARGLQADIIRNSRVSLESSIAGVVAKRGKPILIQHECDDRAIKKHFSKPSIAASIVVPLKYRDKTFGVFCLNSEAQNERFNQENLQLLDQLGRIASIAMSRLFRE